MRISVVTTTINVPVVLEKYVENYVNFNHKDIFFIVVGDLCTPIDCVKYVRTLSEQGVECIYLSPLDQERLLRRFPRFGEFLPYNVVQRRNVGYLHAAELGADIIISIDDDNFPWENHDFFGHHSIIGQSPPLDVVETTSRWYNPCFLLESDPPRRFYHRGYPLHKRWVQNEEQWSRTMGRVVVNAGLWTEDPDVDTLTRLEEPFTVSGIRDPERTIAIGKGTMLPFNSQCTAFHRDLLPALYLISFPEEGNPPSCRNFRYDDIWMSFFIKVIADHMGDRICIGPPHVRQTRNPHNFIVDLRREIVPMELTVKLADILPQIELTATTYLDCYQELIENLHVLAAYNSVFKDSEQLMIRRVLTGMRLWHAAVANIQQEL